MADKFPVDPYDIERSRRQPDASGGFGLGGDDPLASGTSQIEGESTKDAWLSSELRSRNFRGTSTGFGGDGKTGNFTANDFVSGTLRSKSKVGMWVGNKRASQAAFFVAPDGTGRSSLGNGITATAGMDLIKGRGAWVDADGMAWYASDNLSPVTGQFVGIVSATVTAGQEVFLQVSGRLSGFTAPSTGIFYLQDYSQTINSTATGSTFDVYGTQWFAQGFSVSGTGKFLIGSVRLKLQRVGAATGNFVVSVRSGVDAFIGTDVASVTLAGSSITTSVADYTFDFSLDPVSLPLSYGLALVLSYPSGTPSSKISVSGTTNTSAVASGEVNVSIDSGATFSTYAGPAMDFYTTDRNSNKVYKHTNFTSTVSDSISVNAPEGLTIANDGRYVITNGIKMKKLVGFTSVIYDSFSSPSDDVTGIVYSGSNLISADNNSDKIYKHSGFTSTILDSFSSLSTSQQGIAGFGSYLVEAEGSGNKVYRHNGFTSAIFDSFSSPSTGLRAVGVTYDGSYVTSDTVTGKFYRHTGFSATVTDSFSSPGSTPTGMLAVTNAPTYFDFNMTLRTMTGLIGTTPGTGSIQVGTGLADGRFLVNVS